MDIHQNARTTPASRAELVARVLDDQLPLSLVAAAAGVCPRTVRKWIARYQAETLDGLADRSSRPHRQPRVGHTGSHRRPHHGVAEREWSTRDPRCRSHPTAPRAVLTPLYVKTRVLSGLGDGLACAEGCHDALVDLSRKEAFQASDDLAFGPAIGGASGDVVAGWLVESPADDDGSIEGGGGLSVAASLEAVPAGGHPGRGRDRARAAELREGGVRTNPVRVIAEEDQRMCCNFPKAARERLVESAGLRLMPPPRTSC